MCHILPQLDKEGLRHLAAGVGPHTDSGLDCRPEGGIRTIGKEVR